MTKNLSEVLFSKKENVKETSTLIKSNGSKINHTLPSVVTSNEKKTGWYRLLKLMQWHWQGINVVDSYEVLAKISASSNQRSDLQLLDTVVGFRPGNWCYEWSQKAMVLQKQANVFAQCGERDAARKAYYRASQYYSVASYPHLKGDENSIQAQSLAFLNYRSSFEQHNDGLLKEILVPFQRKKVRCYLHLPDDEVIHPVVIVSTGIDGLQCDLLPLFEKILKPAGFAMLTVDVPGVGFSSHIKLDQNTSKLHQAVLHHMEDVPWVDHSRMSLMGVGFGGNIVNRLAYVEPMLVNTAVTLNAAVASIFDNMKNFSKLSPMTLDCFASRMQMNNSDATYLYQYCLPFSLVKQGLLGRKRTKTPLLSISHAKDLLCNERDLQLIARSGYESEFQYIDKAPIFASYLKSLEYSAQWLTLHMQS
jgi:esterase FrsA